MLRRPPQVEANTLVRFIPAHIRALPHNGTAMLQGQLKKLSKSRPGVKKATLVAIAQRKRCMQASRLQGTPPGGVCATAMALTAARVAAADL